MIFWLSFQSTQALKKDFDFFIFVKSRRDRAIFYFPWFSVFSENEILFIVLLLLAAISAPVNPERSSRPPPLGKLAWMFWPRDLLVTSSWPPRDLHGSLSGFISWLGGTPTESLIPEPIIPEPLIPEPLIPEPLIGPNL